MDEENKRPSRIELLKTYLEKSPDDSFLNHALALEYVKLEDDKTAINLFEKLLEHDPNYIGTYFHLAKSLERIGNTEQAEVVYEKGIQIAGMLKDIHARSELQSAYDDLVY